MANTKILGEQQIDNLKLIYIESSRFGLAMTKDDKKTIRFMENLADRELINYDKENNTAKLTEAGEEYLRTIGAI